MKGIPSASPIDRATTDVTTAVIKIANASTKQRRENIRELIDFFTVQYAPNSVSFG
jgi:hypothetical protein